MCMGCHSITRHGRRQCPLSRASALQLLLVSHVDRQLCELLSARKVSEADFGGQSLSIAAARNSTRLGFGWGRKAGDTSSLNQTNQPLTTHLHQHHPQVHLGQPLGRRSPLDWNSRAVSRARRGRRSTLAPWTGPSGSSKQHVLPSPSTTLHLCLRSIKAPLSSNLIAAVIRPHLRRSFVRLLRPCGSVRPDLSLHTASPHVAACASAHITSTP